MDTISSEIPAVDAAKQVRLRIATTAVAVAALGALGAGYALGSAFQPASQSATIVVRGAPATWADAVQEAKALKRHAVEASRTAPVDIRKARVER